MPSPSKSNFFISIILWLLVISLVSFNANAQYILINTDNNLFKSNNVSLNKISAVKFIVYPEHQRKNQVALRKKLDSISSCQLVFNDSIYNVLKNQFKGYDVIVFDGLSKEHDKFKITQIDSTTLVNINNKLNKLSDFYDLKTMTMNGTNYAFNEMLHYITVNNKDTSFTIDNQMFDLYKVADALSEIQKSRLERVLIDEPIELLINHIELSGYDVAPDGSIFVAFNYLNMFDKDTTKLSSHSCVANVNQQGIVVSYYPVDIINSKKSISTMSSIVSGDSLIFFCKSLSSHDSTTTDDVPYVARFRKSNGMYLFDSLLFSLNSINKTVAKFDYYDASLGNSMFVANHLAQYVHNLHTFDSTAILNDSQYDFVLNQWREVKTSLTKDRSKADSLLGSYCIRKLAWDNPSQALYVSYEYAFQTYIKKFNAKLNLLKTYNMSEYFLQEKGKRYFYYVEPDLQTVFQLEFMQSKIKRIPLVLLNS